MSESPPAPTSLAPPPAPQSQGSLAPHLPMSGSTPPNLSGSIGAASSPPAPTGPMPGHGPIASTPPNLPGPHGPLPPGAGAPFMPPLGPESAFYPLPDNLEAWRSLPYAAAASMYYCPYDGGIPGYFPNGYGMDLNGARRKNATRETTSMLKQWLSEHRKNPYPTKGEKIMLAIITKMTLTQVSTWFANARRRLKKENKMTWSPRNRCEEDEQADAEAEKNCDGRDSPSDRRSLDGAVSPAFERTGPSSKRIKSDSGDDGDSDIVDIEDDSNLDMDSNNHLHRLSSSHHNNNSHHHHHLPSNLPHHLHHSLNHHHNNTSSSGNSNNSAGHHLMSASMKQRRSGSPGSDVGSYSDSDTASQTGGHMVNGSINNGTSGSNILLGMTNGGVTSPFNNSTGNTAPTTSSSKPRIWSIADMAAGSKNVAAAIAAHQLNAAAAVVGNVNNATCIPGAQVPGGPPNSLGVPPTSSASALHQQMAAALHPHHSSILASHPGLMGHHPGQLGHPGSGLPPHLSPLAAAAAAAAAANHPAAHHLMAAIAGSTPGSNLYHPSLHPSSLSNAPNLPGGPFGGPPGQTSPSSHPHQGQGPPSSNSSSSTTNVTTSVIPPPPVSSASSSVVAAMSALTGLSPAASMAAFAANQAAWYNSLNPAFAAAAAAANSTNSLGGSSSSSSQSPSPVSPVTSVASSSVLAAAAETSLNRLRAAAAAAAAASLASSNSSSASSSNASSASAAAANAERNSSSSVNRSSPPSLASVAVASAKSAP